MKLGTRRRAEVNEICDGKFAVVFEALDHLNARPTPPRRLIAFDRKGA